MWWGVVARFSARAVARGDETTNDPTTRGAPRGRPLPPTACCTILIYRSRERLPKECVEPAVRVSDSLHGCLVLTLHRAARCIQDFLAHPLLVSELIRTYATEHLLMLFSPLANKTGTGPQGWLDGLANKPRSTCQACFDCSRSLRWWERLRANLRLVYAGIEDSHRDSREFTQQIVGGRQDGPRPERRTPAARGRWR